MKILITLIIFYLLIGFDICNSRDLKNCLISPNCSLNYSNQRINDSLLNDTINKQVIISDIIEKKTIIDYQFKCDKVKIINEPGRGYIEFNFENDILCKATTVFSYSSGAINSITDFYFWDDKIIYIFQLNEYNTKPKYYTSQVAKENSEREYNYGSKKIIKKGKYFIYENKLIRYVDNNDQDVETLSTVDKVIIKDLLLDANMIIEKSKKH